MKEKINQNIAKLRIEVWAIGILQIRLINEGKIPLTGFGWMEYTKTKDYADRLEKIKNLKKYI